MTDSVPVVPNPNATYSDQRTQSVIAHRNHVRIAPKYGGTFTAGSTIRLEIPSQDWLDPDLFSISFNAKIFQKDGTSLPYYGDIFGGETRTGIHAKSCRFDTPIQTVFHRILLLQGSTVIEDIQDYGSLMKILTLSTVNSQYIDKIGSALEGIYDVTDPRQLTEAKQRHAWGRGVYGDVANNEKEKNKGWNYNVKPLLGLMRAGKYLPLKWMGQLTIEIHLESNESALISSTTISKAVNLTSDGLTPVAANDVEVTGVEPADFDGAYYEISDVNMECHFVQPIEEYDKSALALIEEKGLEIWFDTFSTHVRQFTGLGRSTNSFQERAVSLKGGFAVMQNSADLHDIRSPITFSDNAIQEYQWKVGSHYVPAQPIKCRYGAALALPELMNSFDAYGDISTSGSINSRNFTGRRYYTDANVSGSLVGDATLGAEKNIEKTTLNLDELKNQTSLPNSFIMALNLERSPDQLSGFNSAAASVDVELTVTTTDANDILLDIGPGRDPQLYNAGYTFQPSKFLGHLYFATARKIAEITGADGWIKAEGVRPAPLTMITKPNSTYSRLTFYAHIDAVMKVERVGAVSIMR